MKDFEAKEIETQEEQRHSLQGEGWTVISRVLPLYHSVLGNDSFRRNEGESNFKDSQRKSVSVKKNIIRTKRWHLV